ncbi:MAG: hypothetical protein HS115_04610 [Spirochaetales bacterium]|nr:hypothetical protein [Spirochaetales bacterium]
MVHGPHWELKNEKNKNHIRWLLICLVAIYLGYLEYSGRAHEVGPAHLLSWQGIGLLFLTGAVFSAATSILLGRAEKVSRPIPEWLKYITMLFDMALITAVLVPTGGSHSLLFFLYFIVVVSNAMRYGMRLALVGVFAFNLMYTLMLLYQHYPSTEITGFAAEILKVAAVWLVGIYAGYLARRFEHLRGEVDRYKELVRVLMDRAGEGKSSG